MNPAWTALLALTSLLLVALAGPAAAEGGPGSPPAPGPTAWGPDTPVGRIVAERPETARVFELVGVDYCCGGRQTVAEAAEARDLDPERLLAALLVVGPPAEGAPRRSWSRAPAGELIDHIQATHHAFLRRELPRLESTVRTVTRVHGGRHPDLADVQATFLALAAALARHLEAEEGRVFPALRRAAAEGAAPDLAAMADGLRADHDEAGRALHALRTLTHGFEPPEDACALYRQMLAGLEALERDLHEHVHLENNVLLASIASTPTGE